jgi:ribosomal protein L35AE/L33A
LAVKKKTVEKEKKAETKSEKKAETKSEKESETKSKKVKKKSEKKSGTKAENKEEIASVGLSKLEILGMEGVISNYKRGRHTLHPKHCIIVFPSIKTRKDANKMVGRMVVWISSTGKELKGIIVRAQGNKGAVRAHFKKAGVPGQALGTAVKIIK